MQLGTHFAQALMDEGVDGGLLAWDIPHEQVARIPTLIQR